MKFIERKNSNASKYPNYVNFKSATGCWSSVGMRGGKQDIGLASGCGTGSTIHEIGHAFGLWHEQSREDRDKHITVNWQNIKSGREHNFNQHITDADDYNAYDFGSIMHYGRFAFSKNNQPTIAPKKAGVTIGQRSGLSSGDIAAIHAMYKTWHSNKVVKRAYTSPHSKNAHVYFSGIGWRKIKKTSANGVTNMFLSFCQALANGKKVTVQMDGTFIYQMYMN